MSTQNITEEMFKVGVHYGYSKSRRHPSTSPYIFTTKNGVDIINIEKTNELLQKALDAVTKYAASGKTILFVGTKPEARQQIIETALALNMPYVGERWVGGALTNFPEIKKRILKLLDLRTQKEKGELDKYTKKEKLLIDREMEDMTKNFQGLTGITRTPDAVFIVDPKKEHIATTEAKKMGLPIIALVNTDCNIKQIEYPIVANDASISSITFFLDKIKEAYTNGANGATPASK
ncbi:MAG TPA: 30S ribosomal protein S2 [Candidatus Paceibacterota bacterium]|nr:30S ribosomal protein S2 [Candidatus Paceibacterota bacterium]